MNFYKNNKEKIGNLFLLIIAGICISLFFISIAIGISKEFRLYGNFNENTIWASGAVFGMFFIPFMDGIVKPILQKIVLKFIKLKANI